MRPVRLEIEGLRSFRSPQTIDFRDRNYIAVIGDTGAGKSSILEALTFALYGRTTFSGQGHQELMNASATALRVVLAFDVGGDHWEVTRTLRRAGNGKVGTGVSALRLLDDDGNTIESIEKARDVTARVETILGLDDEAFLRTVVLPQGQFSRLLVDDDQKLRSSVLRQIWRTDELTQVGEIAAQVVGELGPLQGRVQQALDGEPEDPEANLMELEHELKRFDGLQADSLQRHRTIRTAIDNRAAAVTRADRARHLLEALGRWNAAEAKSSAARLEATDVELLAAAAELDELAAAARAVLAAVPSDDDGFSLVDAAAFETVLQSLPGLDERRSASEVEVVELQAKLDEATTAVERASSAGSEAAATVLRLREQRGSLAAVVDSARTLVATTKESVQVAREASAALDVAQARAHTARSAAADHEQTLADARAAVERTAAAAATARDEFDVALRTDAAAQASHGLHEGDQCPVCEATLPPGWRPQAATGVENAREAHENAGTAAARASDELARLSRRSADVTEEVRTSASEVAEAGASSAAALIEVETQLGKPADLGLTDAELISGPTDALTEAVAALEARDAALESALLAKSECDREAASAEAGHEAAVSELKRSIERSAAAAQALSDAREQLPDSLRPGEGRLSEALAAAGQIISARRDELNDRAQSRSRHQESVDQIDVQRRSLDDRQRSEVDQPADALWTKLITQTAILDGIGSELHLSAGLLTPTNRPAPTELRRLTTEVSRCTDDARAAVDAAVVESEAAASEARASLDALRPSSDIDDAQLLETASAAAADAEFDRRQAEARCNTARDRLPFIAELRAAANVLTERYVALSDLSAAMKDGAFPKWLTLRRSRSLLVHASRLLSEITSGRYAFADLDDDESQWFVFDNDNGQPRSPASLSGGEKFVASLALALGMVEMMGRQGDRIESLFLDEGFGALDRSNLDAAVEALGSVAATGRLVAVITHIRAVAEQIEHVLSVTREPTGSRTTWLGTAARDALVETSLDAPGGMLE